LALACFAFALAAPRGWAQEQKQKLEKVEGMSDEQAKTLAQREAANL